MLAQLPDVPTHVNPLGEMEYPDGQELRLQVALRTAPDGTLGQTQFGTALNT